MSSEQKCAVLGDSVLPSALATLEHNVATQVECSASKLESNLNILAVEYKRTRWLVSTLLALCMVILLEIFLR